MGIGNPILTPETTWRRQKKQREPIASPPRCELRLDRRSEPPSSRESDHLCCSPFFPFLLVPASCSPSLRGPAFPGHSLSPICCPPSLLPCPPCALPGKAN